jgi:hypothetical protein
MSCKSQSVCIPVRLMHDDPTARDGECCSLVVRILPHRETMDFNTTAFCPLCESQHVSCHYQTGRLGEAPDRHSLTCPRLDTWSGQLNQMSCLRARCRTR